MSPKIAEKSMKQLKMSEKVFLKQSMLGSVGLEVTKRNLKIDKNWHTPLNIMSIEVTFFLPISAIFSLYSLIIFLISNLYFPAFVFFLLLIL